MKFRYLIVCIILIFFVSLSAVCAETDDGDNQNNVSTGSFTDLESDIEDTPNNAIIYLDRDYAFNESCDNKSTFKDGILIDKNITIEGNNHIIDAKNLVRIFNINSDIVIRNIVLVNGYHPAPSFYAGDTNGGGAINIIGGGLHLENATLLNHTAYSSTTPKGTSTESGGGAICVSGHTYLYVDNCNFMDNRVFAGAGNVAGGAIMFKAGSAFNVTNSVFINNSASSSYMGTGGAIGEVNVVDSPEICYITNCTFIENIANGGFSSILAQTVSMVGNLFINSGVTYSFGAAKTCSYNTFIDCGVGFMHMGWGLVKHNWYGVNPSPRSSDVAASIINEGGNIYVKLTTDGGGNNLSNPEYLHSRNVIFKGDVKYGNVDTVNGVAANEITKLLKEGYVYSVNATVDRQNLVLYFKYVNENNDFNSTVPSFNESYSEVSPGKFRINGSDKIYHSFYEAVSDALSMDGDATIYVGEGVYTEKWSDNYYNYEYMNYNFDFTSNNKVITVIGAGNDKSVFKGESRGFKINGNSTFRFVNMSFADFTDNIFTFNVTNSDIYFTNCIFRNISTDYGIYLDGENSTLFIDGCYLDNVKTHPFWNAADNSYIVIDSTIFYATNYNYAFSEIYSVYDKQLWNDTNNSYIVIGSTIFYGTGYTYRFSETYLVHDETNRILTVYHDFDKYYVFKHNFLFGDVTDGFDCTPQVYLSNESIMLGDSVDIVVDFNYFTNSSGTYRFDSNFIDDFTVSINTASGSNTVNLKNGVAILKYTPTDAGTQTIIVKYGSKSAQLTLNIDPRQMPSFNVEGTDNIIATLPSDAKGNVTFNVNGNKVDVEVVDGIASIDLSPLSDIKYTVEVTYSGDSNYLPASTTLVFSPYRNITYLDIRCNDTLIYTDAVIDVYTNAYGSIRLMIDGEEYTSNINNNVARFTISDLTAGIHNVTAVYEGNSNYLPESNASTINIIKYNPTITSYVKTVLSGNDVIMNITLNEDITSEVYIFMNGKAYKTNIYNGVGYLNFTRMHGGSYSYRLYFNGNEKYYASEINSGFTVTKLNVIYVDGNNGDDENMGISRSDALKSLKVALECIRYGGTIYICEGVYNGIDNSRLTFTQSVNVIGLGDVTFDGELKNYFFTIDEGINVKFKDINFKNIYSYVFDVSRISHVNVENCEFYGGSGSAFINEGVLTITDSTFKDICSEAVILNYATVNVYDSVFDSLTSTSSSMGLAISNYGTANVKNSIFKDSTVYGEERVYGLLYNNAYMSVESCIFDSNTAVFVLYPIGTANIYNAAELNATYNVFIKNKEFDINEVHGDEDHKYIDLYNDRAGSAYIDFNWWDCTDSPYDMHLTNTKPGLWVIYDISIDEYTALDIGDNLEVNVHLALNNGSYFNDNRLKLHEASFDGIVNQLVNYGTSFNFNKTSVKASYEVPFEIAGFKTSYLIEVGKNHSSINVDKKDVDYGETLQIRIHVSSDNSIPTGNVTVILGNNKYNLNLTDGNASLDVDKLLPGTYDLKVVYEGDDDFFKCYYYGNVTVFKQNSYITIDLEDIMVGQKGVAHISIEPDTLVNAKGYIYIDGVRRNIYFYQGKATYELKKFDIGQYDIRVEFLGNDYYYSSNASTVFHVHKYQVKLNLSIDDVYVGQRAYLYIAKDPSDLSGEVHFIVEGTTQRDDYAYLNPEQSETRITLKNLGGGLYNITVFYEGDTKYEPCNASVSFTVIKYTPDFYVNVTYNDTVAHIDFNLTSNEYTAPIGGVIQFWHNDNFTYINVTDGYASYDFNLTEGYNYLFAYYMGDANYNYTLWNTTIVINVPFVFTGEDVVMHVGDDDGYRINLTDPYGKPFVNQSVIFNFTGELYRGFTDVNGSIFFPMHYLDAGVYNITASYNETSINNTITVLKHSDYLMNVTYVENVEGNEVAFNITLPGDATGNVTINGKTANVTDGQAQLVLSDLESGNQTFNITYNGDRKYEMKSENITIDVGDDRKTILEAPNIEMYYHDGTRFEVSLTDRSYRPLANQTVTVNINGINYNIVTGSDGKASLALNLPSGTYDVFVSFENENYTSSYVNSSVYIKPTVFGWDVVKIYRNATRYVAAFTDFNGDLLTSGEATFNINGILYKRTINSEGIASLAINLIPGTYIITATNPVTGEVTSNTVTVLSCLVENHDLVKYYKNESQYTVRALDSKGNPVGAGEYVLFNINGIFYTRQTDENGYATLSINLPSGDYIITAEYNFYKISNNIKVKPVLSAYNLVKKQGTSNPFRAFVLDGKGRPLEGATVTFNVNGVLYEKITDIDGVAKLNINLPVGRYIITSMYNGAAISNSITIA